MTRMSKKFEGGRGVSFSSGKVYWRWFASILLIVLVVFTIEPIGLTQRAPQQSAAATSVARNAALIAATSEVLKETSEIRQLSILRPVQSSTQSRAEIERSLVKNMDEEMSAPRIHAAQVTLVKLGLVPTDFQYRAFMIRLLTEQVAGYYDPKTQWFHLADWIDLDGQRPVMAHELTHALQDQHFNLRRFEHWPRGDSDAELAAHALIEGDATLAMALYVANDPLRALTFLKSLATTGMPSEELNKAPRILRETLLFPYEDGEKWVSTLYKQGGWPRVSKAFDELPLSTEQVLHPEKYFAHEAPVKVSLPEITNLLGSSTSRRVRTVSGGHPATAAEWRLLDNDVNGEWGLYLILDEFLKSPSESRRAAAGWGGDRFAVYEGPGGHVVYVSLSEWDTEADAVEFFDAYTKRCEMRYPNARSLDLASAQSWQSAIADARGFSTNEGKVVIERSGKRVLTVEGVPEETNLKTLTAALLR
jgi:hypothetical protein